jgi:peroxiredoxin
VFERKRRDPEIVLMNRPPNQILEETFRQCCDMDASLNERLARFAAVSRKLNPAYANLIDQLVERIESNQAGSGGPQPGDPMPPFLLTDQTGRMVSLSDVIGDGPVALIFHRGHWCPYCRINTKTLAQAYPRIKQAGGKIVAVMPDRQQYTAQMIEDLDLPFPILTDLDNGYAMSLDLAIWLGAELRDFFGCRGHDLPGYQGNDSWIVPIPATFVVGTDGCVRARFIDPDYRRGLEIDKLLSAFRPSA